MKKAVITTGGKQYIVSEGDVVDIERVPSDKKALNFDSLLVIDDSTIKVGKPLVDGAKVSAEIVAQDVKADKVTAIRYKAKKRVNKKRGHRQIHTQIKITKIG
jgi:large subunit ribosomal protein L21